MKKSGKGDDLDLDFFLYWRKAFPAMNAEEVGRGSILHCIFFKIFSRVKQSSKGIDISEKIIGLI